MTSEVAIYNKALGWLGQDPITSFNDKSSKAELGKLNYPTIRDAVLESRMWSFALFRAKRESGTMDDWGQSFIYPFEQDWIKVFRVYRDISLQKNVQSRNWVVEDNKIIAEDSLVYIWGVKRVITTTKFSPLFVEALAARIAADLCVPITENVRLQADLWNLYEMKLAEAAARDGGQGRSEVIDATRLTNARAR